MKEESAGRSRLPVLTVTAALGSWRWVLGAGLDFFGTQAPPPAVGWARASDRFWAGTCVGRRGTEFGSPPVWVQRPPPCLETANHSRPSPKVAGGTTDLDWRPPCFNQPTNHNPAPLSLVLSPPPLSQSGLVTYQPPACLGPLGAVS